MGNGVLRVVSYKIHSLTFFSSGHNKIPMANAHKDAIYADSLRKKIAFIFSEKFYIS